MIKFTFNTAIQHISCLKICQSKTNAHYCDELEDFWGFSLCKSTKNTILSRPYPINSALDITIGQLILKQNANIIIHQKRISNWNVRIWRLVWCPCPLPFNSERVLQSLFWLWIYRQCPDVNRECSFGFVSRVCVERLFKIYDKKSTGRINL